MGEKDQVIVGEKSAQQREFEGSEKVTTLDSKIPFGQTTMRAPRKGFKQWFSASIVHQNHLLIF